MNSRKWVLSNFSDNKLLFSQLFILIKTFFLNFEGSEFVIIMLVSSTNTNGLDESDIIFGRSIMYKTENNGPSLVELCLTGYHLKKICQ
jgi:hypothetical protein